jgi:hypothetical protein
MAHESDCINASPSKGRINEADQYRRTGLLER